MCDCKDNIETLKDSMDLTIKNNKNTTISVNINCNGSKKKVPSPANVNTIPLDQAIKWTKEWRDPKSDYNKVKHKKIHAFNIPKIDLIEVLNEKGVDSIRAYIGVKETTNKSGGKQFEEKLLIVGVDENGKDLLPSSSLGKTLGAEGNDDGIFDFTEPCPEVCDEDSPLY
jgi:hypothetical protein